jgi:hypothetical protein
MFLKQRYNDQQPYRLLPNVNYLELSFPKNPGAVREMVPQGTPAIQPGHTCWHEATPAEVRGKATRLMARMPQERQNLVARDRATGGHDDE